MSGQGDELLQALGEVRRMPYGLARTQVAERLARRAETDGPRDVLPHALCVLVESYVWGGEEAKAYVPFQALVRLWDTAPEIFDENDVMAFFWSFKWMVGGLKDFPWIPASQIEATLRDMERRYALAGNGTDAVAFCAFSWADHRRAGDVERVFDTWVATPRDEYSQCEACSLGDEAEYLWSTGRAEQAVRHILDVPPTTRWCATEPADMLAVLALAQAELGRPAEAASAHRRATAALERSDSDMATARGRAVELLARGGQVDRAVEWLERDGRLLVESDTPLSGLSYAVAVLTGLSALPAQDLARPIDLAGVEATDLGGLRDWIARRARDLAQQFDARNGTGRWVEEVDRALAARPFPQAIELGVLHLSDADEVDVVAHVTSPAVADRLDPATAERGESGDAAGEPASEAASSSALAETAERLVGQGDLEGAAEHYLAAARSYQEEGWLVEAGFGYAEAARCAQELGDDEGAHAAYQAALVRLRAGGGDPESMVAVLVAWAPTAARPDRAEAFLETANALLESLSGIDPEEIPDDRLRERRTRDLALRRAELDDALSRVIATVGQVGVWGRKDAVDLATQAAELFAEHGDVRGAAHAFWAAGRMLREEPDGDSADRAVFCLESAVEGFGIVGDRSGRGAAANELIALLRATGQDARAEEILGTL